VRAGSRTDLRGYRPNTTTTPLDNVKCPWCPGRQITTKDYTAGLVQAAPCISAFAKCLWARSVRHKRLHCPTRTPTADIPAVLVTCARRVTTGGTDGHRHHYTSDADSIGAHGEDGPTHQPNRTLGDLRAIPKGCRWSATRTPKRRVRVRTVRARGKRQRYGGTSGPDRVLRFSKARTYAGVGQGRLNPGRTPRPEKIQETEWC